MVWVGQLYFYVCAAVALAGALATVIAKNPIRGAMGLLTMIVAIAGLFLALNAQFLAAIQLIVYAGAIVVLFLFVIMLLGPSSMAPRDRRGLVGRAIGGSVFGLSVAIAIALSASRVPHGPEVHAVTPEFGGIDEFGRRLFAEGLVPFELSSALLMVAVVGAVAVARGKQGEEAPVHTSGQPGMSRVETAGSSGSFATVRGHRLEVGGHTK